MNGRKEPPGVPFANEESADIASVVAPDVPVSAAEIRIYVVTDDPLYGNGVKRLLEDAGHGSTVYVASLTQTARLFRSSGPPGRDVVLWIGEEFSAEVLREVLALRSTSPSTGVCVLADSADRDGLLALLQARGGPCAFLLRGRKPSVSELLSVLRQVGEGHATIEPSVLRALLDQSSEDSLPANLTAMERRVLELLAAGLRNREIARRTRRSEKAIERHIGRIFAKLGLNAQTSGEIDRRVVAARIFHARGQQLIAR